MIWIVWRAGLPIRWIDVAQARRNRMEYLVDSITVRRTGTTVTINIQLPDEAIARAVQQDQIAAVQSGCGLGFDYKVSPNRVWGK
jgi:hypothetical protein